MTGSLKIVIDTNILFMAWYNPFGKCAEIMRYARQNKIQLFASDSVKEEIKRVFSRQGLKENETNEFLSDFPIVWIDRQVYESFLEKTKVKHKADKPVEAVALLLGCEILSANKHFKERDDINRLLKNLSKEEVKNG